MPIYEFYCQETNTIYQFFARSQAYAGKIPHCPDNPDYSMRRAASKFSLGNATRKSERDEGEGAVEDDPKMMQAMAELEKDLASMDEDNPDPRQLAKAMRRMSDVTNEPLPAEMREMIGRMEAGEDLEALEEEFGHMDFGDEAEGLADGEDGERSNKPSSSLKERLSGLMERRASAARDDTLYDIIDYL